MSKATFVLVKDDNTEDSQVNLVFVFIACLLMSQVFLGVCFSGD